jgi:hypothetical protein
MNNVVCIQTKQIIKPKAPILKSLNVVAEYNRPRQKTNKYLNLYHSIEFRFKHIIGEDKIGLPAKVYKCCSDVVEKIYIAESRTALRHLIEWDFSEENRVEGASYYVLKDLYDKYVARGAFTEGDAYEAEQHLKTLYRFLITPATCRANHSEYRCQ